MINEIKKPYSQPVFKKPNFQPVVSRKKKYFHGISKLSDKAKYISAQYKSKRNA